VDDIIRTFTPDLRGDADCFVGAVRDLSVVTVEVSALAGSMAKSANASAVFF